MIMKALAQSMLVALFVFSPVPVDDALAETSPAGESFKVKKGGDLIVDIENVGADVYIKVWSKLEVTVRAERIRDDDLEYLDIEQDGNTVRVDFDPGYSRHSYRSARFYINVPSEFNLDVGTSGGSVEVAGSIKGAVDLVTAGGNIEIDDVNGEVTLTTAGGNIVAGGVEGDARLRTAGGNVRIGDVAGDLAVATAGGNITVGNVGKNLGAGTAGGNIRCENVGGEAGVETSGGNIELGVVKGEVDASTAGGNIAVMGSTGETTATTAGGDIELENIVGYVKAVTAGGDITVELGPTNEARSSMKSRGGDITLYLPANAKATIEAQIRIRDWEHRGPGDYEIYSDFSAEEHETSKREVWARYVINGGGKVISIETVNGNIDIRKQ